MIKSIHFELKTTKSDNKSHYLAQATEYEQTLNNLANDLKFKTTTVEETVSFNSASEYSRAAVSKQKESLQSTTRSKQIVENTIQVGNEASSTLNAQTSQMKRIDQGLDDLSNNLKRANQQVKVFVRRMATDKLIMVLFLMVILGIVASIVVPLVKGKVQEGNTISTNAPE